MEIKGTLIEECAHFNIFEAEYNSSKIIYRVWRNGKVEFKITEELINSGLCQVPNSFSLVGECWIDPYKRG